MSLDGFTVEDFWDWAVEPLLPIFQELPTPQRARQPTLHAYFSPETYVYTLRAVSEELVPEPYGKNHAADHGPRFGVSLADESCAPWTYFSPSQIRICEERVVGPPSQTPGKVLLNDGTTAFLKLVRRGDKRSLKNELDKYMKIDKARLDDTIRISRLQGLVRDESGLVLGLLLTYINCKHVTLSCAVKPETPITLRQKWVMQLRDSIDQLLHAGIVWGDAKSDNVLIDSNRDAWVVDSGGGYTEGWVPKQLTERVEGDRHGLEKIVEFIGI